ncbi:MAG: O-methyltransferase [Flavobacteriales bacterium]|nr:O-methyltransferase [Flavobacteriales bacterium]MCW8913708.1 O-methyltransferase [Flavobacteriales bacterium]MCW8937880.1 O-methyltransferase [Flavobacteriales bacterium]MCW8940543.1 O-methyltransferase [Flavobacteriales bacterium]MCW8967312.1 O-methyltransferase [Flavobacteriales bacterium]
MDFLPESISKYVEKYSEQESELLQELNHETWEKILTPRMLSGHLQGRVLSMLSHMIQPENILEIGTYTGYSALCLAEGLKENGSIDTIDINEELESFARKYFDKAGLSNTIKQHIGNALDIIPTLNKKYDIVFIDADKSNYINYYNLVFEMVNPGGYIIADNVLWSGKVTEPIETMDEDTKTLVDYAQHLAKDNRVQQIIFPIRDGLMIARKK